MWKFLFFDLQYNINRRTVCVKKMEWAGHTFSVLEEVNSSSCSKVAILYDSYARASSITQNRCMSVWKWVEAECVCVFSGSQLCPWLPSIIQVSDQRGEGGQKKRKLEDNWFYRHLERVQTRLLKHKNRTKLQKCLQGCFTSVFLPIICYHHNYKNWVLAFEKLGSDMPLIVPWEEKYIHEKTIWLIKDMNKRSYIPCVCFILHCSQLTSNCGIKGMFVSVFLELRCCVKAPSCWRTWYFVACLREHSLFL